MRSNDVIALHERVHIGMHVLISRQKMSELLLTGRRKVVREVGLI